MKSIAARLAIWYALSATVTIAGLSAAGYFMLQKHLINGLDLLNAAEFQQIQARLGPAYRDLNQAEIDARIRETTDYASVLFYIDIRQRGGGTIFRSTNLRGRTLPDIHGQSQFIVSVDGIGELRSGEFLLPPYEVMIATPLKPVQGVMQGYPPLAMALSAIMLVTSVAIGYGLSHFALRPVRIIEATAGRISTNNLSERIPLTNIDTEVANLAQLLNQMFGRLETSFDQIRRFTADASHELKTPLSLIRLQAERMLGDGANTANDDALHVLLEEISNLNEIIEELLLISRAEAGAITLQRSAQDVDEYLQAFSQDARVLAEHNGLRYADSVEGMGSAAFDPRWMRQVLLNLLSNAIKVSPRGGVITLRSTLNAQLWRVSIEDQGPGVAEQERIRIFERFVRVESPKSELHRPRPAGAGLGLAICRSIVELHRGRIWAEATTDDQGLRVVVELPAADLGPALLDLRAVRELQRQADLKRQQQRYTD